MKHHPSLLLLLSAIACSPSTDEHGMTPLMRASRDGQTAEVRRLLQSGADVDARVPPHGALRTLRSVLGFFQPLPSREVGWTALTYGVSSGQHDVVQLLLDAGADPNLEGAGLSPLVLAVIHNDAPMARRLLLGGARPSDESVVAAAGADGFEMLSLLLEAGGHANARSGNGITALMAAAVRGNEEAIRLLIAEGVELDARDGRTQSTALQFATRARHENAARLLAEAGASTVGLRDDALIAAVRAGDVATCRSLLEEGANPNSRDAAGDSVLSLASRRGDIETVEALLEAGADLGVPSDYRGSALAQAAAYGHLQVANVLLRAGAPPDEGALIQRLEVDIRRWCVSSSRRAPTSMPAAARPFASRLAVATGTSWASF